MLLEEERRHVVGSRGLCRIHLIKGNIDFAGCKLSAQVCLHPLCYSPFEATKKIHRITFSFGRKELAEIIHNMWLKVSTFKSHPNIILQRGHSIFHFLNRGFSMKEARAAVPILQPLYPRSLSSKNFLTFQPNLCTLCQAKSKSRLLELELHQFWVHSNYNLASPRWNWTFPNEALFHYCSLFPHFPIKHIISSS